MKILIPSLCLLAASVAQAQNVTFDFDNGTPALQPGQTLPFDQSSGGITAHFSSPSGPVFSVQSALSTGWTLSQFSGKYLYDNNLNRNLLDIKFSQSISKVTLNFATNDFHQVDVPTSIQLTAYVDATTNPAVGTATAHGTYGTDTLPMGSITFDSGGRPFNLIEVTILFQPSGGSAYFVDNIVVTPTGSTGGGGGGGGNPGPVPPAKLATFRPIGGSGTWALDNNGNYAFDPADFFRSFGLPGDQPVAGDWDGTGVVRMGVFRGGVWYLDLNNNGQWDGPNVDGVYNFGLPGDTAVVGDWTGNGVSRFGIFRCVPGGICTWVLDVNGSRSFDPSDPFYQYGLFGDIPVVNNWDGTGKNDQLGVYRPMSNGLAMWIVDNNGSGAWEPTDAQYQFGLTADLPIVGNWVNGTRKRIGVFRNGQWILDLNGDNAFQASEPVFSFGLPGDTPMPGNWNVH